MELYEYLIGGKKTGQIEDLNKTLYVWDQRTRYDVFSTFKMDDKPFFELVKKEIKNSKK